MKRDALHEPVRDRKRKTTRGSTRTVRTRTVPVAESVRGNAEITPRAVVHALDEVWLRTGTRPKRIVLHPTTWNELETWGMGAHDGRGCFEFHGVRVSKDVAVQPGRIVILTETT